ncbi:MAG TPA: class I SAM-dependent methyltransferase [Candidatus Binatia bacterium]|nr:class I SAM-dependent methyltransferase [Candidatus Binatia bacterium]
MPASGVKEFYSTVEYISWADRRGLTYDEKYLIERYLDKKGKTLEAGTGGGRILFEMKDLGFTSLHGFDFVPGFIARAKERDMSHSISFEVQDATSLFYEDSSFDQIVYLQQFICVLDDAAARTKALKEAHRILRVGGTALFSFLSFRTKSAGPVYPAYLGYLYVVRKLRRSDRSIRYFPYNYRGGRLNLPSLLLGTGPYLYRYTLREAYDALREVGFNVTAVGSREQINRGVMYKSIDEMEGKSIRKAIYFVCTKLTVLLVGLVGSDYSKFIAPMMAAT